jgi:hypothetical protein
MNHAKMTLAITAIVAAASLASVALAVTQQAIASTHNHHNNDQKGIKVDQQVSNANNQRVWTQLLQKIRHSRCYQTHRDLPLVLTWQKTKQILAIE